METLRIPPMHKAALVLTPLQPDGEPAPIDGDPIYELDSEDFASIVYEDGVAKVVAGEVEGSSVLTVRSDVRLGDQVNLREKQYELLVAEEASNLEVSLGDFVYTGVE